MGKKRKKKKKKRMKIKFSPQQIKDMFENRLRSSSIPSAKIYDRKKKDD